VMAYVRHVDFETQHGEQAVRVCLVRHGEKTSYIPRMLRRPSLHAWENQFQELLLDDADPPLTKVGIQQAKDTARRLQAMNLRNPVVLASPLFRTMQTANQIASAFETPIICDYGLFENLGSARVRPQSLKMEILAKEFPIIDLKAVSSLKPADIRVGEEPEEVQERMLNALSYWIQQTSGARDVVIVSHGSPILYLAQALCKVSKTTKTIKEPYFCGLTICTASISSLMVAASDAAASDTARSEPHMMAPPMVRGDGDEMVDIKLSDGEESTASLQSPPLSPFSPLSPLPLDESGSPRKDKFDDWNRLRGKFILEEHGSLKHVSKKASFCTCGNGCLHIGVRACRKECIIL